MRDFGTHRGPRRVRWSLVLFLSLVGWAATAAEALAQQIGPSFACPMPRDPLAQLICSSADLSRLDLEFTQVYQALRQQVGEAGQQALRVESVNFGQLVRSRCGVANAQSADAKGPLPPTAPPSAVSCVSDQYRQQKAAWQSRLTGAALEEATRPISQQIGLQRILQRAKFLSDTAKIDGVYGSETRAAITAWQGSAGRAASGLLSDADALALWQAQNTLFATVAAGQSPDIVHPVSGGIVDVPQNNNLSDYIQFNLLARPECSNGCDLRSGDLRYRIIPIIISDDDNNKSYILQSPDKYDTLYIFDGRHWSYSIHVKTPIKVLSSKTNGHQDLEEGGDDPRKFVWDGQRYSAILPVRPAADGVFEVPQGRDLLDFIQTSLLTLPECLNGCKLRTANSLWGVIPVTLSASDDHKSYILQSRAGYDVLYIFDGQHWSLSITAKRPLTVLDSETAGYRDLQEGGDTPRKFVWQGQRYVIFRSSGLTSENFAEFMGGRFESTCNSTCKFTLDGESYELSEIQLSPSGDSGVMVLGTTMKISSAGYLTFVILKEKGIWRTALGRDGAIRLNTLTNGYYEFQAEANRLVWDGKNYIAKSQFIMTTQLIPPGKEKLYSFALAGVKLGTDAQTAANRLVQNIKSTGSGWINWIETGKPCTYSAVQAMNDDGVNRSDALKKSCFGTVYVGFGGSGGGDAYGFVSFVEHPTEHRSVVAAVGYLIHTSQGTTALDSDAFLDQMKQKYGTYGFGVSNYGDESSMTKRHKFGTYAWGDVTSNGVYGDTFLVYNFGNFGPRENMWGRPILPKTLEENNASWIGINSGNMPCCSYVFLADYALIRAAKQGYEDSTIQYINPILP